MIPAQFFTGRLILAGVILALVGVYTSVLKNETPVVEMRLVSESSLIKFPETFTFVIEVESATPVNAFAGMVSFDTDMAKVVSIDYNTSIADLWVEEPWYSAGDGTISFAGGTTKPGAFSGIDTLMTITLEPLKTGLVKISLDNARIYVHDGLGTEANVPAPLDALFTVEAIESQAHTVTKPESEIIELTAVVSKKTDFDLNSDGKINFADTSIFMIKIFGNDPRYDFNRDGKVDGKDLDLLLKARD